MLSESLPSSLVKATLSFSKDDGQYAFGGTRPVYINRIFLWSVLNQLHVINEDGREFEELKITPKDLYIRKQVSGSEYESFKSLGANLNEISSVGTITSEKKNPSIKIGDLSVKDITWATPVTGRSEPKYTFLFSSIHYSPEEDSKISVKLNADMKPILKKFINQEGDRLEIWAAYMYSLKAKNSDELYRRFVIELAGRDECRFELDVEELKRNEEELEGVETPKYINAVGNFNWLLYDKKVLRVRENDINKFTDIHCTREKVLHEKKGRRKTNWRVVYTLRINQANISKLKALQNADLIKRNQLGMFLDKKEQVLSKKESKYLSVDLIDRLKLTYVGLSISEIYWHYDNAREIEENTQNRTRKLEELLNKDRERSNYELWRGALLMLVPGFNQSNVDDLLASCESKYKTGGGSYIKFVLDSLKGKVNELQRFQTNEKSGKKDIDAICNLDNYTSMLCHEVIDLIARRGEYDNYHRIIYTVVTCLRAARQHATQSYDPVNNTFGKIQKRPMFNEKQYMLHILNKDDAKDLEGKINDLMSRTWNKFNSEAGVRFQVKSSAEINEIYIQYKDKLLSSVASSLTNDQREYYFDTYASKTKEFQKAYMDFCRNDISPEYDVTIANMLLLYSDHKLAQWTKWELFEKDYKNGVGDQISQIMTYSKASWVELVKEAGGSKSLMNELIPEFDQWLAER